MRIRTVGMLVIGGLACGLVASGASPRATTLVAGGTEVRLGDWVPGQGSIEPGGRIRGWSAEFQDVLIGPAGALASGTGPVTMNCNLDEDLTGPCWGRFHFRNSAGSWEGVWQGTFSFATGSGSYRAVGHGLGGFRGMVLENDAVFPGFAVSQTGTGYIYSTVRNPNGLQ